MEPQLDITKLCHYGAILIAAAGLIPLTTFYLLPRVVERVTRSKRDQASTDLKIMAAFMHLKKLIKDGGGANQIIQAAKDFNDIVTSSGANDQEKHVKAESPAQVEKEVERLLTELGLMPHNAKDEI